MTAASCLLAGVPTCLRRTRTVCINLPRSLPTLRFTVPSSLNVRLTALTPFSTVAVPTSRTCWKASRIRPSLRTVCRWLSVPMARYSMTRHATSGSTTMWIRADTYRSSMYSIKGNTLGTPILKTRIEPLFRNERDKSRIVCYIVTQTLKR